MNLLRSLSLFAMTTASLHATEIVAHRGFSAQAPENTVAAFKLAWEHNADACELDLYMTADQQIAIIHDENTKRTTGKTLVIKDTPLADLQALDSGSFKNKLYKGEPIPTLAQALDTMPLGKKRFFLEVKCGPEVVAVLAKQLKTWRLRGHQLCIIAFDREVAQQCKKALPWIKVYRLASEKNKEKKPTDLTQLIADTKADGLDGLDLSLKFPWSEEMVKEIRDAKLELHVWTVDRASDIKRLAALGVDGITTNNPVVAQEALK